MSNRRNFLKNLGLFGAGAGAFTVAPGVATAVTLHSTSNCEADGPICSETLEINCGTKLKPAELPRSEYTFGPIGDQYEEYKRVSMAVGRDGNLWLKAEGGDWKRIVTE